jgi:hypothetical protein
MNDLSLPGVRRLALTMADAVVNLGKALEQATTLPADVRARLAVELPGLTRDLQRLAAVIEGREGSGV